MKLKGILNIAGRVLKGAGDIATGGVVSSFMAAKSSKVNGEGNNDFATVAGYVVTLVIIIGMIYGDISPEVAEDLIEAIR